MPRSSCIYQSHIMNLTSASLGSYTDLAILVTETWRARKNILWKKAVSRDPESVYRAYGWYKKNHLSLDKFRFKATKKNYISSGQLDNFTILSYELARLSIVPGSVNMLLYFNGQIIFCKLNCDSRLRIILYFVQSVRQFVQFILLVGHIV